MAAMPDFALVDSNTASASYNDAVSPSELRGTVTAWYFAHANCNYCSAQFGQLDVLQAELEAAYPALKIEIFGVNESGYASSNPTMTAGRTIPWLQDVDANQNGQSDVWTESWNVAFRDLVILDGAGEKLEVFNLTQNNLTVSANYATLRQKLVDAAMESQLPWHNAARPSDVDGDTVLASIDAMLVIIELNTNGARKLEPPTANSPITNYFDTDGDGRLAPIDVMQVIIALNQKAAVTPQSEGPFEPLQTSPAPAGESPLATFDILALDALLSCGNKDED